MGKSISGIYALYELVLSQQLWGYLENSYSFFNSRIGLLIALAFQIKPTTMCTL